MNITELVENINKDLDEIGDFTAHNEDGSIYIKNTGQNDILSYEAQGILDVMKKYNFKFHAIEFHLHQCYLVFGMGDI